MAAAAVVLSSRSAFTASSRLYRVSGGTGGTSASAEPTWYTSPRTYLRRGVKVCRKLG